MAVKIQIMHVKYIVNIQKWSVIKCHFSFLKFTVSKWSTCFISKNRKHLDKERTFWNSAEDRLRPFCSRCKALTMKQAVSYVASSFFLASSSQGVHSVVEAEGQDVWPNHGIHLKHLPTSYIIANFLPAKAGLWSKPSINGMGKYILTSSGGKCYKITCIVDVLMDVFFYHREGIRTGRNNTIYHIDKILTLCQAPRSAWQIITPLFVL